MAWHRYTVPKLSREHSSLLAVRLAKKIKKELDIDCDPDTFRRTYVGYWQKSLGAWLWTMKVKGTGFEIGSCDPASECVKSKYHLSICEGGEEICAELRV